MDAIESMFRAVYADDLPRVKELLASDDALARCRNAERLSILQFAQFIHRPRVFQELINADPSLDVFEAASLSAIAVLQRHLEADPALVDAYSPEGFTALHLPSYYSTPECVGLLLERGAAVDAVTRNFLANMPLHAAAARAQHGNCALLLEHGADVNAKQHGGFTPLHTAAHHGDGTMTELFLEHGADPRMTNDEGKTPAELAASQGNVEIAAMLRCAS
jgi:uncharacterized protein